MKALLAVGLVGLAACGGEDDPGPIGQVVEVDVPAGTFVEADFDATTGDVIEADYDTGGVALNWNVHTHRGDQEERYTSGTSDAHVIEFTAPESLRYSFYWENLTETDAIMLVTLRIDETTTFRGWFP